MTLHRDGSPKLNLFAAAGAQLCDCAPDRSGLVQYLIAQASDLVCPDDDGCRLPGCA
jgi:hypothetical protein